MDVQNSRNTRAPSGSTLFDMRKSSMAWILPIPGTSTPAHTLKPSTHGSDNSASAMPFTRQARLRDQPHSSMLKLMMFSNTATTVDSAAKLMNRKNSVPHSCPTGIWLNTLGSVMNTRPGPLPGSTPNAKHAGKMMRPATSATAVSKPQMRSASPVSERSLPM